nr:SDR family NAD(P)-dependent oxidoreductase [Paenibacillus sp. WQ 127069]
MGILKGKVAIVTGAGSEMGREEAILLAGEGAQIVATDINAAAVQAVVKEIEAIGGQAIAYAPRDETCYSTYAGQQGGIHY